MNFTEESSQDVYSGDQNNKHRSSFVAVNLRQENEDRCNNFDGDNLDYLVGSRECRQRYENHSAMEDEAGFAAIELLPPSSQFDASTSHFDDGTTFDDNGHPGSSSGTENGIDVSCLTLEDLLYQLQREIVSSISHLDAVDQFGMSSNGSTRKFTWSIFARSLLENTILKLKVQHQEEMNGCYSASEDQGFYETLHRVLLPLWPHGWMSSSELDQAIKDLTTEDLIEDEFVEDDPNQMEHSPIGEKPTSGGDDVYSSLLYGNAYDDETGTSTSRKRNNDGTVVEATSFSKPGGHLIGSTGQSGIVGSAAGASMCFICDRSFQSAHLLKIHISHMHTPKALMCPHCHSRHSTLNGLRFHFSTKHKGLSQKFSDMLSSTSADSLTLLNALHHSTTNNDDATTTTYNDIRVPTRHEDTSTKATSSIHSYLPHLAAGATGHYESTMNEEGDVECFSCKIKFPSTGTLKVHMNTVHSEKTVKCRYCNKFYATQRAMLQHTYLKHHKERNRQCPHCGEKFQTQGLASLHRRYSHGCNSTATSEPPLLERNNAMNDFAHSPSAIISEPIAEVEFESDPLTNGSRGIEKYHCRDCGAGFPMPSAVWAHRKKEHIDSTSIKKRGVLAMSDPGRKIGGQIFANDLPCQSKELTINGKKKMRVKCSVCTAVFSNGYACYLHKKKIHGEESIRRELNLSERSPSIKINTMPITAAVSPKLYPTIASSTEGLAPPSDTLHAVSNPVSQPRISSSSSSSRDSSPFYRPSDIIVAEGVVRRRYEFHCQCGMTFYNGFAYSRHRQRTGCSDGVRGIVVKESVCGVCSEAFSSPELLNEHFSKTHTSSGTSSVHGTTTVMPKFNCSQQNSSSGNFGTLIEDGSVGESRSKDVFSWATGESTEYRRSPACSSDIPTSQQQQRIGATATAYVTTTVIKTSSGTSSTQQTSTQETGHCVDPGLVESGNGATRLRCIFCPYETSSVEALAEHSGNHETGKKAKSGRESTHSCPYCSYVASNVCNYIRHASIHFLHKRSGREVKTNRNDPTQGQKASPNLDCVFCGRRFQSTYELMAHELLHTGK